MTRAEKHLGYKVQVEFEEGLRRTIDWYKEPSAHQLHASNSRA
jgi:dTDP-D-glucose 4,6-dehydratase